MSSSPVPVVWKSLSRNRRERTWDRPYRVAGCASALSNCRIDLRAAARASSSSGKARPASSQGRLDVQKDVFTWAQLTLTWITVYGCQLSTIYYFYFYFYSTSTHSWRVGGLRLTQYTLHYLYTDTHSHSQESFNSVRSKSIEMPQSEASWAWLSPSSRAMIPTISPPDTALTCQGSKINPQASSLASVIKFDSFSLTDWLCHFFATHNRFVICVLCHFRLSLYFVQCAVRTFLLLQIFNFLQGNKNGLTWLSLPLPKTVGKHHQQTLVLFFLGGSKWWALLACSRWLLRLVLVQKLVELFCLMPFAGMVLTVIQPN